MSEARLLVVDDDPKIQRLLQSQLTLRGFTVQSVSTGREALMAIGDEPPQLVLLDLSLPEMDGISVCKQLRGWSEVPVILLTANDAVDSKIAALESGADDYLTKPFHMGELMARIRSVLRRANSGLADSSTFSLGDIMIDLAQREVRRGDELIHLTRMEFDLLAELVRHADKVLTYGHLLNAVWGAGTEDIHSVHVHVSNLRRKLERGPAGPRHILAVSGIGYRLRT